MQLAVTLLWSAAVGTSGLARREPQTSRLLGGGAPGGGAQELSVCSRVRVCVCVSVRHWCPMAMSLGRRYQAVRPPQHGAGRWPQKGMSTSNPQPCTCGPIWKWGLCGCSYVKDLGEIILGGP